MLTPPDDVATHHARLLAELQAAGLTPHPAQILLLAQALAQYDRCTAFLNVHGQVMEVRNDKGEVKQTVIAPEANLQLKLLDKIRALMKDVGLAAAGETDPPGAAPKRGNGHNAGLDKLRDRLASIGRPR